MTDVVFLVKQGPNDSIELRYALRSLRNIPHGRVILVGDIPDWVTGVETHHLPTLGTKYATTNNNMRYVCEHPDMPDTFAWWMDDTFLLKKQRGYRELNRGTIRDVINEYRSRVKSSAYVRGMEETLHLLEHHGYTNPLSFELHIPTVINKTTMLQTLDFGAQLKAPHKRSIYGALAGIKGTTIPDVKVYRMDQELPQGPWVSSNDNVFKYGVGNLVRWLFPNPGPYEK